MLGIIGAMAQEVEQLKEAMEHGRLTAKFKKNLYRPHKAYIFLSIFSFLYIGFLGFLCYNGKGGIDYESEYIKI